VHSKVYIDTDFLSMFKAKQPELTQSFGQELDEFGRRVFAPPLSRRKRSKKALESQQSARWSHAPG